MTGIPLNAAATAYDIFDSIQQKTILGGSSELYQLAQGIGCVFCCAYLVYLSGKIFRGSGGWTPWDLAKPIVILILIENFSMVVGFVDGSFGAVCKGIAGYTEDQFSWDLVDNFEEAYAQWTQDTDEDDLQTEAETDADGSGFLSLPSISELWESLKDWVFDTVKSFFGIGASFGYSLLAQIVATVAEWIGFVILIFSKVYLLVLAFIGPFVFAVSIIPSFHSGVGQWFARYLQISFWYPILQVINLVYVEFVSHIPDMIAGAQDMDSLMTQNMFATLIFLFVSVAVIFMYFSVPKVAAWLIQSTGANNAHGNAGRAAGTAAAAVAKAVL